MVDAKGVLYLVGATVAARCEKCSLNECWFLQALRRQSKPARFRSLPSNDDSSFLKKLYHSTYYQVLHDDVYKGQRFIRFSLIRVVYFTSECYYIIIMRGSTVSCRSYVLSYK